MSLVLASTSRYRKEILGMLRVPFICVPSDFDERAYDHRFQDLGPIDFALLMAAGKATNVREKVTAYPSGSVILAADQVVSLAFPDGSHHQFHKPGNPENAVRDLMLLSGKTFTSTTGICAIEADTGRRVVDWTQDRLTMRSFSQSEAEDYVQKCAPLDCAGSYRISDGLALFSRIQTQDWHSIQGMPMLRIMEILRGLGVLPE